MKNLTKLAIAVVAIANLNSCYNSRKATDQVDKAVIKYPVQTAKQLRDKWPCIPTITIPDSSAYQKYYADLLAMKDFYESQQATNPVAETLIDVWEDSTKIKFLKKQNGQLQAKLDSTNLYVSALLKFCKDRPPIHDTVKVKDMADVRIVEGEKALLLKQMDDDDEKMATKNLWLKIFAGLALLEGIAFYVFFRKR